MSTIHPKKEKLIYKCTKSKDCKKVFSQRYRLTIHEKSHLLESQIKDRPMTEDILTDCPSNQYLSTILQKTGQTYELSRYSAQKYCNKLCDIEVQTEDNSPSYIGTSTGSITISTSVNDQVFTGNEVVVDIPSLDDSEENDGKLGTKSSKRRDKQFHTSKQQDKEV